METFLKIVAHDLCQKTHGDFRQTAIIFPNKRANLFFNEYLAQLSETPLWAPSYLSISELFAQLTNLKQGDPIQLVCELYKVFCQETGSQETLDDFYFWGELLISDFDDVDKNMVNASHLFTNLHDLKDIMEGHDFLDKEQEEAIRHFFSNFLVSQRTQLKERFISLWDKLGNIYNSYHQKLEQLGIAYEGMMYRQAIEQIDNNQLPFERYVFVGFNVLNKVEKKLFQYLQKNKQTFFYWDYDAAYTRIPQENIPPYIHEAGEFIMQDLKYFPNQLPDSYFNNLQKPKQVRIITSPTENAQAYFLPEWYKTIQDSITDEKENAVVLCNEALLLPVLHSLPTEVKHVNITMGFPLSHTPIYSFIQAWLEMQINGYHADSGRYTYDTVQAVLKHPYTRNLSSQAEVIERQLTHNNRFYPLPTELQTDEFTKLLFTPLREIEKLCHTLSELIRKIGTLYKQDDNAKKDGKSVNQLYQESVFKAYTLVNRMHSYIESGDLADVNVHTLSRLLCRMLSSTTIPFHGEPAMGIQVMGVLETRNLDFRNLIMLSLNEGQLPKTGNDSSFIPYNLRKAFGMTTIEHKNAVYAYYFYRLIQRAENITLLYNNATDGINRGEMSRFLLQFCVEYPYELSLEHLEAQQSPIVSPSIQIAKTPQIQARMQRYYDADQNTGTYLSPSALNAYIDCPLCFYYRYVANLKMSEEVSTEIDSALFGTLFHRSAQLAYSTLTQRGEYISKEDLEQLIKDKPQVQSFVDQAFHEIFFHSSKNERIEYNGTQLIQSKVIASYLLQLLRNDLSYAPFYLKGMEKKVSEILEIEISGKKLKVQIGGTIDRIDGKEDTLRIVDYKTGGLPHAPENIEQLFIPAEGRASHIFQIFLYSSIVYQQQPLKVTPALLYIHRSASDKYTPIIEIGPARQRVQVDDFARYDNEFRTYLQNLLDQLFDPDTPFTQTQNESRCLYCDYRKLCQR